MYILPPSISKKIEGYRWQSFTPPAAGKSRRFRGLICHRRSHAALCRREGIAEGLYYSWSKEFLEAGKKRLAGDTGRQATSGEVKGLRQEMRDLKELVAELSLENRLLKKT